MPKVKKTSRYDFAYSVAVVRSLEKVLINSNEIERMTLAKNPEEAFRIFNEFDYADNLIGVDNPAQFQKVIEEGLLDIRERLEQISPDQHILNILWFQYDFHNIKTLVKAKLAGKEFEEVAELMSKLGVIPVEALVQVIFEEKNAAFNLPSEALEKYIKAKIKKVQKLFVEKKENPQVIDLYLDQKLMKIIFNIAKNSGSAFLVRYIQTLIDISNIKLLFRMKDQEKDIDLFEMAFLWNGKIPYSTFKIAYKAKLSDLPALAKATDYAKIIAEGYKHYESDKTLLHLETACEDHLTNLIREAKLMPFGPEPLIAYYMAKKNNALIIRMILISKLNKIDPEEIKKYMRKLYQ